MAESQAHAPDEASRERVSSQPSTSLRPAPLEWVYLAAGLFLVIHYSWLLDDAYVYFRYVDNWVLLERGIVYNPGEFAEGYTSPAWLLLLAATRALGLGYWPVVQGVAIASFVLFWLLAVRINRELSPLGAPIVNLPLAFLSLNYGVLCYFSSGTESPLVQLMAGVFVLCILNPGWRPAPFLLPFLPIVRPELALALLAALIWQRWKSGRMPWLTLVNSALVGGGWLLFRIVYYAELFPVTFYLKNLRDFGQGLLFVHDSFGPYRLYWVVGLAGIALFLAVRREGARPLALDARLFVALLVIALLAYTVKIGGDGRHFRYLAFPVCALLLSLGGLAERWTARMEERWAPLAVGLVVALFSFSLVPRQLDRHPAFALDAPPRLVDEIGDAAHHRLHPDTVSPVPWSAGDEIELEGSHARWRARGGPDLPLPVRSDGICYRHYVHFDHWGVHAYGLTDGVLARVEMAADRPAHKEGLEPMARDIVAVLRWWKRPPAAGMYRAAVEAGVAAPWMRSNLHTLELLERKLYNRHDLLENLGLALHVRERIDPG